jgi:hypothetical protein
VVATTDLVLMAIEKDAFTRLLGPLENLLKRNMKKYEKYMKAK